MSRRKEHIRKAVALRYDCEKDQAPRVVAKGRGYIAEKIIQAAGAHGVPLVADRGMSTLLEEIELDAEISPQFYLAVAQILAFVYRLDKKNYTKYRINN
nr:EscU/YscU/HrcU family type III secretion system export apparatus switch protein [Desulfobacterales bacterium]